MKTDLDKLVRLVVANHTLKDLAMGFLKYEAVRRMSPSVFTAVRNLKGERFDDIITESLLKWKSDK